MLTALNYSVLAVTSIYSLYIAWQLVCWIRTPSATEAKDIYNTRVSIIIPCRNEEKNIANCLQAILAQDYPVGLMEILVADDHSTDGTKDKAEGVLKASGANWKYVQVKEEFSNKKKAIAAAIKESTGELIVTTDADCFAGPGWITSIVSLYNKADYQMICGPVSIEKEISFLDNYQALEVCGLSLLSGAGIFSGKPLLCNGANLAYTRKAYEKVNGFQGVENLPSGDDTMMLFKINHEFPGRVGFIKSPEAIVNTQAQLSWKGFLQQRIRWGSKGFKSKNVLNSVVGTLVFITNLLLFISCMGVLVYFPLNTCLIISLILKFTVDFLLLNCATDFFRKKRLMLYFLPGELITMLYVSWVGLVAGFWPYRWKERDY